MMLFTTRRLKSKRTSPANHFYPKWLLLLTCVFLFFISLTSCSSNIKKEKLIGRYIWNDQRTDTLEVRADGTYEYWTFLPGRKFANSGNWKFNSLLNEVEFERENFPFIKNHKAEGSWISKIQIKNNETRLLYASETDTYLKQIITK